MEIGFVGLGRMGFNMTLRLLKGGHRVVAWNRTADKTQEAANHGAVIAATIPEMVTKLAAPRAVWIMIPAGAPVDAMVDQLVPLLAKGDLVVDGGNSNYKDDRRRAERLATAGLMYVDAGTSGGIWGLQNGYCMMLGGPDEAIARLRPGLDTLAAGRWARATSRR
jgi:6-phosphogluconate dehydrogenase